MALNKEKVTQNQTASDLFFVIDQNIGKKLLLQRSPNAFFLKIHSCFFSQRSPNALSTQPQRSPNAFLKKTPKNGPNFKFFR